MKNTRLIDVLSAMNEIELSRLKLFLQSPLNNHSQRTVQLFELLETEYPAFDEEKISDKRIFKKIFSKKSFSPALLRNLNSDLLAQCEQFIASEKSKENTFVKYQLLTDYFIEKKLFASAENVLHKWKKELKNTLHDSSYFQSDYQLMFASFNLAFHRLYKGNLHKLYKKQDITILFEKLQNYFLFEFATLSAEVVNSFKAHNQTFDTAYFLRIISFFQNSGKEQDPVIQFRLQLGHLLLSENETLYPEVKKMFLRVHRLLAKDDLRAILVTISGFVAARGWQGKKFFKEEYHLLTGLREKLNLLVDDNNEINPIAFSNYVQSKLKRKGKKEALSFIRKYESHLPKQSQTETVQLALAGVLFYENKFEEAVQLLLTIGKPFFGSEITYRWLLLKCYYELKQWDRLQATIETSEKFLKNNVHQLPAQIFSSIKKNLEAIKLLYRNAMDEKGYAQKLKSFIENNAAINDIDWIKIKLETNR